MNFKPIFVAATLAAVTSGAYAQDSMKMTDVVMLHTSASPFVIPYVAADQGFFEKHGVRVTLTPSTGGVLIQALVANSAQVVLSTPTVVLQALDNGIELKGFASTNIFPDETPAGMVVTANGGIKTPADLKGKKVGVPGLGGLLDVTMRKWIDENGGDSKSMSIVEVPLPQTADALRGGQVDGVASVDPFVTRAVETGAGELIGNYLGVIKPGSAAAIMTMTAEWAEANPEAIKGMQLALLDAIAFTDAHPDEARQAIAKFTTLPPPVVANAVLPNYTNLELYADSSFVFWNDLAIEQGLIGAPVDMADFTVPFPSK